MKSVKVEGIALMHIGEESLDAVINFIKERQVCQKCRSSVHEYGHDLVARYCLVCVLEEQPTLTYLGYDHTDNDNRAVYRFRSEAGSIYTSTASLSEKPTEDVTLALREAGFTLPKTYIPFKSTKEETLLDQFWAYHGKITNSVLVLEYKDPYTHGGGVYALFLAYKQAETTEFSKRTTLYKNLMEKATKAAEHTKRNGVYHITSMKNVVRLTDEVLYRVVSMLESAIYDAQARLFEPFIEEEEAPAQEVTEEQTAEVSRLEEETSETPVEEIEQAQSDATIEVETPEEPVSLDTQRKKRKGKEE